MKRFSHNIIKVTLAAKNLEGKGPRASIELRTEDGGDLLSLESDSVGTRNNCLKMLAVISRRVEIIRPFHISDNKTISYFR